MTQMEIVEELKKRKEEIYSELQKITLFNQWQSLRGTITIYENIKYASNTLPKFYEDCLTRRNKVLFCLNEIKEGYVLDIVKELSKHERFLVPLEKIKKRVQVDVSELIAIKKIKILKKNGRKIYITLNRK